MTGISRRELLRGAGWLGAGVGLASCSASTIDAAAPTRSLDSSAALASPSAGPSLSEVALPKTDPWAPHPAEVSAPVKVLAARLVEAACAWPSGASGSGAARQRVAELGFDPDLVEPLKQLLGDGKAAAVQVVMAQYGGITTSSASVLLVVDQWVLDADGHVVAGGTTLDVRLVSAKPRWRVTEIRPARPEPAAKTLSRLARSLLSNDRVRLPYAAAADVRSGGISDSVLVALNTLSVDVALDVSVLRSGHPIQVFGTDRRSDHSDGLAVDVWALDGRSVIEPQGQNEVAHFMQQAALVGPYQVGGPVDLDGEGNAYFSDQTHQDHVHLGFPNRL